MLKREPVAESSAPNDSMENAAARTEDFRRLPIWSWTPLERRVGLAALILALAARWHALKVGFSIDDYATSLEPVSFLRFASQGRVGAFLLSEALRALGFSMAASGVIGTIALSSCLVLVGIAVVRLWQIRADFASMMLIVAMIVLHPYQTEIFSFRMAHTLLAIALTLTFGAILECDRSRRLFAASVAALVVALSIYQLVVAYAAMAMVLSVAFELARRGRLGREFLARMASQVKALGFAIVAYLLVALGIGMAGKIPFTNRAGMLTPAELPERIRLIGARVISMFFQSEPVMPLLVKLLLAGLILSAAAAAAATCFRRSDRDGSRFAFAFVFAVAVGVPVCMGFQLINREWWPVPRMLAQVGMLCAGLTGLAYVHCAASSRRYLLVLSGFVLFAFCGLDDHILSDELRLNLRDMAKANRIIGRLEGLPQFKEINSVVLSDGVWAYAAPLLTVQGDLNISAFYSHISKTALLSETTGYRFVEAPAGVIDRATAYCKTASPWPALSSTFAIERTAVVCLER